MTRSRLRFDTTRTGELARVGGWSLRPTLRVGGSRLGGPGGGAWLVRARAESVEISDANGSTTQLLLRPDPHASRAIRLSIVVGAATLVVCAWLILRFGRL